jgi:hypothetical protein
MTVKIYHFLSTTWTLSRRSKYEPSWHFERFIYLSRYEVLSLTWCSLRSVYMQRAAQFQVTHCQIETPLFVFFVLFHFFCIQRWTYLISVNSAPEFLLHRNTFSVLVKWHISRIVEQKIANAHVYMWICGKLSARRRG